MEPGNYLRVLLGRWKIIALVTLLGLAAGFATAPARARPRAVVPTAAPQVYSATHILIADAAAAGTLAKTGNADIQLASLLATTGDVPRRAAEALHLPGPEVLLASVSVVPDLSIGTVRITATNTDPNLAVNMANTLASTLLAALKASKLDAYRAQVSEATATVTDLRTQLNGVQSSIARLPVIDPRVVPSDPVLSAQRDALVKRLLAAQEALDTLNAAGEPVPGFSTLQDARAVVGLPQTTQTTVGRGVSTTTTAAPRSAAASRTGGTAKLARKLRVPLAGAMGLFLGCGLALLRERLDTRIRSRRAAEAAYELPVVAEIPRRQERRRSAPPIAVHANPLGLEAESYRLLRSAVLQLDLDALWVAEGTAMTSTPSSGGRPAPGYEEQALPSGRVDERLRWVRAGGRSDGRPIGRPSLQVVLVTSAVADEGKTTVTMNLAAAVSEVGTSALVLDLDLRDSRMRRYFAEVPEGGVRDVLERRMDLDGVVGTTLNSCLKVALGGAPLDQTSRVLPAERQLVSEARSRADVVLLDMPPMLAASDASEIAPCSDGVLLVCLLNHTTRDAAVRVSEALARLRAPVIGVVLVGANSPRSLRRKFSRSSHRPPPALSVPARTASTPPDDGVLVPVPSGQDDSEDGFEVHGNGAATGRAAVTPARDTVQGRYEKAEREASLAAIDQVPELRAPSAKAAEVVPQPVISKHGNGDGAPMTGEDDVWKPDERGADPAPRRKLLSRRPK